jgi:hypothetical protein
VISRNSTAAVINDIRDLTPYVSRWTIKGRCTMKGELKQYKTKAGKAGCVFNFDLMDKTGEIRVVGFNETAERFFDQVKQGGMFMLSKASLKLIDSGKRKWNTTGHDCEAYLENSTIVRPHSPYFVVVKPRSILPSRHGWVDRSWQCTCEPHLKSSVLYLRRKVFRLLHNVSFLPLFVCYPLDTQPCVSGI